MPFAELVDLDIITSRSRGHSKPPSPSPVTTMERPVRVGHTPPMRGAMYARFMDDIAQSETLQATNRLCGTIHPEEIENLIRRSADIKARYLSALLDIGQARGVPQTENFRDLKILRSWAKELDEGLSMIRSAIAKDEVKVHGIDGERV